MPRGGSRPGAGRKRKPAQIWPGQPTADAEELIARFLAELAVENAPLAQRALILKNLLTARRLLRDAPAPGKKEAAATVAGQAAKSGRFATPPPPKLVIDNS
jgi:hypothetical protein